MAVQKPKSNSHSEQTKEGITRITVGGFKSIDQEQSIEIRPLTILAGANSSGKSSIMQPLLLLKQTLEAPYDPGALLLNGPNVQFTSVDQLLSHTTNEEVIKTFHIGIEIEDEVTVIIYFMPSESEGFDVEQTIYEADKAKYRLYKGMSSHEVQEVLSANLETDVFASLIGLSSTIAKLKPQFVLMQNRCFLTPTIRYESSGTFIYNLPSGEIVENYIRQMLHLPGLRGNPERTYPITSVSSNFPGTFENYVASLIRRWQTEERNDKLEGVNRDLTRLGLTRKVIAKPIDDTQVELLVNRFPPSNEQNEDMVSIADVGLGISQTLPVVVALHAANQGQLVYLEQPEIHLHPRAQTAMAEVLADAALQGRRLVVETHSSLLLLGIQTLVAEGKLPPDMVKLHWFKLLEDRSTQITSADLDETGAFGDWPEDFDSVTLDSESRYLDAAQARLRGK